uniref:S-adenosylmethionine decarboxylase n=1 Tax=viral metagenome TaxID=1070528 RepID=A0A6C0F3V7_9ZZZZ
MALTSKAPTVLRTWGKHLILDAAGCSPKMIGNPVVVSSFARSLVKRIDMVPYGDPQVVMFGTGNKKGYTLIQLIETSNIAAHFVEENNSMYLDVFSCKDFDPQVVKDTVSEYFDAKRFRTKVMLRQAPLFHETVPSGGACTIGAVDSPNLA